MNVVIAGASGLVGEALLQRLLADEHVSYVHAMVRKPLGFKNPKLIECDFHLHFKMIVHEAYICLGTTLKTAGSKEAFKAVDYDLCLNVAHQALSQGAQRIAMVSSLGADPNSRGFYLQVKGQTEQAIQAAARAHQASTLFIRPSFLMGNRAENRMGERIALAFAAAFKPLIPERYQPVAATSVAQAMHTQLRLLPANTHCVLESGSW